MANSYKTYTGDNSTVRFVAPSYDTDLSALAVYLDDVSQSSGWSYDTDSGEAVFSAAPGSGVVVKIARTTSIETLVSTFTSGQLRSEDLNNAVKQLFYKQQEDADTLLAINASTLALATLIGTLAVNQGGTGSTTASGARTALGAQAQDDSLDELAALSLVNGDIFIVSGGEVARLAKGSDGEILTLASGLPSWAATGAGTTLMSQDFRLTLESGEPVSNSDQADKDTLYFTPIVGNRCAVYASSVWTTLTSSELSVDLSALTADRMYDVFAYSNTGTLALETLVWTNTTTRATALTYQDGVLVKTGDTSRRYIGTVYVDASGYAQDTEEIRSVWNYYNRRLRKLYKRDSTTSWTYATAAWRLLNADTDNKVTVVVGVDEEPVSLKHLAVAYGSSYFVGIGLDSNAPVGVVGGFTNTQHNTVSSAASVFPGVGLHEFNMLEKANGATINIAGSLVSQAVGGMTGVINA